MSWSWLLLECSWPFAQELERDEPGEAARYGSAFHELLAACLRGAPLRPAAASRVAVRYGVGAAYEHLDGHVRASHAFLRDWLGGRNEFRTAFDLRGAVIEQAVALKPLESGRSIAPHDEQHRYPGLKPGEIPGTIDLGIRRRRRAPLLVVDHKTGESEDFSRPLDKPQMLSLATAMLRATKSEEAIVAIHHSGRRGLPKVYADKVTLPELEGYERRLKTSLERIGDGSMRPGPWCERCPAASACPARDAQLVDRAGGLLTGLTAAGGALTTQGLAANDVAIVHADTPSLTRERKLGLLYDIVKKAEALAGRARVEIKNEILASNGRLLPETAEGAYLVVREFEKEQVSKRSILDAYGRVAGERMIDKLRDDGAITKTRVQQLWPEKERGR